MTEVSDRAAIDAALAGARETRAVLIGRGVLRTVHHLFVDHFGFAPAMVVADDRTYAIAGRDVEQQMRGAGLSISPAVIFPDRPMLTPDVRHAQRIAGALAATNAIPIAVGSGTINDLTKLAAHQSERPYLVIATAASMDGYAASGGAMIIDGFKQTLPCPAPRAVVADIDLVAGAPQGMTAAGYADLLGKITAGADWLVADEMGVEPVLPEVWTIVQGSLRENLAHPERIRANDPDAVERLMHGLIVAGLAMQAADSSRPASGSEHQFSHLWEMAGLSVDGTPVSHGFKVGVGSLAVAALYERLLTRDLNRLQVDQLIATWPTPDDLERSVRETLAGAGTIERALIESRAKHLDRAPLAIRLHRLRSRWPALRARLTKQLIPPETLRDMLAAAGCPTGPSEIGLTTEELRRGYAAARQIRRRYTILDLAAEAGVLEECVAELFAPNGFWTEQLSQRNEESSRTSSRDDSSPIVR